MPRELKRKKECQCEDPIPDQHVKEGPLEPGMSMSVKTMRRSLRDSRMVMASSALDASIDMNPAASTELAA